MRPSGTEEAMDAAVTRHLPVATCIGCGARSHSAECPSGCSDVPLDLVDVSDLDALSARADALAVRLAELRELAGMLADDTSATWAAVRERARAAVRLPVPPEADVEIIEAWGCPVCGRIDAPQQCLGICVRRPGMVADAREYRELAARTVPAAAADRELTGLAEMAANLTPRPGTEDRTLAMLRSRARAVLDRLGG